MRPDGRRPDRADAPRPVMRAFPGIPPRGARDNARGTVRVLGDFERFPSYNFV